MVGHPAEKDGMKNIITFHIVRWYGRVIFPMKNNQSLHIFYFHYSITVRPIVEELTLIEEILQV